MPAAENCNSDIFRDLYRDAFGCRPRGTVWTDFIALSEAEQSAELARLSEIVADEIAREQEAEAAAAVALEARIADLITTGAGARPTALRWIADAEGVIWAEADCGPAVGTVDWGYLEYKLGLASGYLSPAKG